MLKRMVLFYRIRFGNLPTVGRNWGSSQKFAKLGETSSFPTISITLNPEQETIVSNLIATGGFQTTDEVLQVALRLLEKEQQSYQTWLTETREKVQEGIASLDRGEGVDGETVVNDLLAKRHFLWPPQLKM